MGQEVLHIGVEERLVGRCQIRIKLSSYHPIFLLFIQRHRYLKQVQISILCPHSFLVSLGGMFINASPTTLKYRDTWSKISIVEMFQGTENRL